MKKENSFSMTLKKLPLTFSLILFYFLYSSALKADLIKPSNLIKPKEVVQIQLNGLMNNDDQFKDRGIEQTWSFAHPDNKKKHRSITKFQDDDKRKILSNAFKPSKSYNYRSRK